MQRKRQYKKLIEISNKCYKRRLREYQDYVTKNKQYLHYYESTQAIQFTKLAQKLIRCNLSISHAQLKFLGMGGLIDDKK